MMMTASAKLHSLQFQPLAPTEWYGRLSFGPVLPGQGLTVGNTLRRVLLNDLKGISVVGAEIAGVDNEFSTLPGVRESVVEIFLNLRDLVFTHYTPDEKEPPSQGELEPDLSKLPISSFPYVVRAGDLDSQDFKIVDPTQPVATLLSPEAAATFQIYLFLSVGRGYQSWKKLPGVPQIMGQRFFEDFTPPTRSHTGTTFPIDAIFMPVKRVNFTIRENLGEGEYIYFELWTNGSLHPLQALRSAAKVCMKPSLTDDLEPGVPGSTVPVQYTKSEALPKFESIPIEQLELSLRAYNCLKRAQILTLADLAQQSCSDLLSLRNFGQKSAEEVRAALRTYGIELKQ
ncbi:unnamed protein product [Bathycoccus prasinos]